MQPLLDTARRTILADLTETLDLADLDDGARERVEAALTELLDDMLVRLDAYSQQRGRVSAAGACEFMLLGAWPLMVRHMAGTVLGNRDCDRLLVAMAARREAETAEH